MGAYLTVENLLSLLALGALEIVLGIDNIVFIAIMVGRLPAEQRKLEPRFASPWDGRPSERDRRVLDRFRSL